MSHLTGPEGVEDKEQLYEDASKRQDSPHHDPGYGLRVQRLLGDLTRDLIGPHGVVQDLKGNNELYLRLKLRFQK